MSTGSVARSLARSLRSDASTSTWNRLSRVAAPSPRPATRSPLAYAQTAATTTMTCTCAHLQARYYSSYPTQHPAANANPPRRKRTIMDLQSNKRKKIPITMLTAHDYPSARFIEAAASSHHHHHHPPGSSTSGDTGSPAPGTAAAAAAKPPPRGVDIALIGDSLAMVACGYPSTTHLTLDEMLYHCRSVARGCKTSLLVADLPYGTFAVSVEQGVHAAVRITQEGHMDAVKIEGGEEVAPLIKRLTDVGIPVMGHVGLTPQRQAALSGYRVQGKTVSSAMKVYHDALAIQHAGAFAVVLEAVPARLAEWISSRLEIPTIGIGAGKGCDGQVLVQLDMLGVDSDLGVGGKGPRFLKKYASLGEVATGAVRTYVDEVRNGAFPGEEHTYPISDEAFRGFLEAVAVEEQDPSERL